MTFTFDQLCKILPFLSKINVDLLIPKYFFPYIDFSIHIPNFSHASLKSEPSSYLSLYLSENFVFFSTVSLDAPKTSKPSFLKVISFTAKPYVSALSILTNEEKESGVVCIDIGSGSTSISIFIDGSIVFAKSINIGAWYISSDISKVLSTPFDQAEAIKTFYGSALRGPNDGEEIFSTPLMGSDSDERLSLSKSRLISIIQPRFYEILMHAKKYIEQSGYNDIAKRNTVITGGGSELIGSVEFSERTLESRVHIGKPRNINGLNEQISGPVFSSCAGMLIHSILSKKKEINAQSKQQNFAYKLIQKIMGSGF